MGARVGHRSYTAELWVSLARRRMGSSSRWGCGLGWCRWRGSDPVIGWLRDAGWRGGGVDETRTHNL